MRVFGSARYFGSRRAAVTAILCAALTTGVCAAAAPSLPSALSRTPVATDRLPSTFQGIPGEGRPYDIRRIATYKATKRHWSVYIFRQEVNGSTHVCVFVFTRGELGGGAGGGCSPSRSFFGPGRQLAASAGRVLAGVASDRVARVVVIGSLGVVHQVPLSPDHGFIFNCRAYNGCACVVSRLQAFDRAGNRITNQNWLSPTCRRS